MGCSRDVEATNYLSSPDIDVCCEFDEDGDDADGGGGGGQNGEDACEGRGFNQQQCLAVGCCQWDNDMCWSNVGTKDCAGGDGVGTTIGFAFEGDVSDMLNRVAFPDEDDSSTFCSQYIADVKADIACSLAIPKKAVIITYPTSEDSCGNWKTEGIFIQMELMSWGDSDSEALRDTLLSQHKDVNSHLWRGYLTKTLKVATESPTKYPTTSPFNFPTKVPSKSPVDSSGSGSGSGSGSDDGTTDPSTVCKECATVDTTIKGVSDKCFIAAGNFRADPEPEYLESCEGIESASDVSIACKKAVVKYFDCIESKSASESKSVSESKSISESDDGTKDLVSESDDSKSSTITVTGTVMTVTALAVTLV